MRTSRFLLLSSAVVVAGATVMGACGGGGSATNTSAPTEETAVPVIDPGDGGDYAPTIDAADFVDGVDHPYFPLSPGSTWIYEGEEGGDTERVEVVVTPHRKEILGISAVVVRDTVYVNGELVEDTYDWFAQDRDGNVWYLGEDTKDYENGEVVSTEGAWEAGVDGAQPGIVMPADPQVGDAYRQEFSAGAAEDMGEILRLDASESVPFGDFDGLLVTEDWTPLEPDVVENKYYARGIGNVLEIHTQGGAGRIELISFTPGG
jgi:hypothetical protein